MKRPKNLSTDGFIPRSPSNRQATKSTDLNNNDFSKTDRKALFSSFDEEIEKTKSGYGSSYFGSAPVAKSEKKIDKPSKKLSRRQRRQMEKRANKKPRRLIFRIMKWFLIIILLAGLSIGGYTAYKIISAGNNVFQGSIIDIFNNGQPLKKDKNDRSNFLIFGTSEDDPGHEASYLTDSMMVISVSQDKKDVYMFSVPRDLEVEYGRACSEGYRGKINSYYECVNGVEDDTDEDAMVAEQERLLAMRSIVGKVYGIDIQYAAHVNYTVLKEVVDAVGGIDVYIEGSMGESGILDRNADWRCNYECFYVKYDNGIHHLDGEHALYLALARGHEASEDNRWSPTYGLSRSNPDREVNQQKIIVALKDKALSTGTLTNLGAISSLIESLGNNLRTNIQMNEIRTLLQVAGSIKTEDMHTVDLITEGIMNGEGNPIAGNYDYTGIQKYITKKLSNNPIISEDAPVVVLNGTDEVGLGQTEADSLRTAGYNIYYVDTAPENTYETTEVYQIGADNSGTASALAKLFNVTVKTTEPPIAVDENTRFVVIIGADVLSQ